MSYSSKNNQKNNKFTNAVSTKDLMLQQDNLNIPIDQQIEQDSIIEIDEQPLSVIEKTYVTTSKLNLRQDAGLDKPVIIIIPKGDEVIYDYQIGDWFHVKYKDYTGFCMKQYLQ